jgi:hypothetical protein
MGAAVVVLWSFLESICASSRACELQPSRRELSDEDVEGATLAAKCLNSEGKRARERGQRGSV